MSKIEWTDKTWNPVTGCTKISPGCKNCYAERIAERFRGVKGHPYEDGFDLTLRPSRLDQPMSWGQPHLVFVNSMSDLFHDGIPDAYIVEIWDRMIFSDKHIFQVLTKRPERARNMADQLAQLNNGAWPKNVWMGVSVENDDYLWRVDILRDLPARVRFLSCEPLLGPLDHLEPYGLDWIIVGGESGPRARRMEAEWARDLRDACVAEKVPFFFKQWGEYNEEGVRVGKQRAGRLLDMKVWNEMPLEAY